MKIHLFLKQMLLLAVFAFSASLWGQTTFFNFGTTYSVPPETGWTSTGTVEGGSYLKLAAGSVTSTEYVAADNIVFKYDIGSFGSGGTTITKLIVLNASNVEISQFTLYSTTGGGTYTKNQTVNVGSISSSFKVRIEGGYGTSIRGTRLQNFSLKGDVIPTGPTVTTTAANSISTTSATLNGTINANGFSTAASFDWGPTAAYANNIVADQATITGTTVTPISAFISLLAVNTQYHYRAVGKVGATITNGTDMNFWTLANAPNAVTVNNAKLTSLDVALNTNGNPVTTEYTIEETTTGKFVQADGTLGATAVWQTSASWGTKTVTGLTAATEYTFQAKARNGANVETAFGTTASGTTSTPILVSYNLVQSPNTEQSPVEGTDFKVYIRAYAAGITEAAGESTRLKGWVGYSSTNDNPANTGWTWIPATFNAQYGNNDEYQANIPTNVPGTYYYAARFEIDNSGSFTYGGSAGNWDNDNVKLNVLADVVDYANIQSPATASIIAGNTVTVYAQVYEPSITEAAGQGAGISAEIGYSNTNGTPDGTWTWLPATFNVQSGNNDEYKADLGAGLSAGTYYYASRFKKSTSSTYVYGGTGGKWNNDSGVLTVSTLGIPTATAAADVASTSFTANWDAVSGADAYELDVYTTSGTAGSTITETFSNIDDASSGSYNTRVWIGDGSIGWTAYKSRTDQVLTTGNLAVTLRDQTGAYLESGLITNGLTNISFNVQQFFGGSGGVLTVKVLTGPTFTTVTTIGTIAYNTTASTYNSGVISGITGDYKILIENNTSARAGIDNLSFTSASTSTKTYVLEAENVGNVTSYLVSTLTPETNYIYVVRAKAGAVTSANSNEISVTTLPAPTTTWNGTAWSNGIPDANKDAIINSDYSDAAFEAKSLTVNAAKTLTVNSFVKAVDVTNEGNILVADNGNFVQTGVFTAVGSSTFKVNRTSQDVSRLDYISWSSPLENSQTLKAFSPQTVDARFLTYNNGLFVKVADPNVAFNLGQGYLIRTPNNFIDFPTVQKFNGVFEGTKPNTGSLSYNPSVITGEFVFLGNPYPSAISMQAFYDANAQIDGSFYIWDSVAAKMDTNDKYSGSNYITHTSMGSVPAGSAFIVPVAQGFFINRGTSNTALLFNDGMRQTTETGTFAKVSVADKFWLQMTAPSGAKPQMLIGFSQNATSGYDQGMDAKMLDSNADVIYSTVDTKSLIINALGTFSTTDVVNVTANFLAAGNYTISIAQKEGIFTNGQQIYLKDHVTGAETELTIGDYSFAATAGLQADRFTLYFSKGVLATSNVTKGQSTIYADHQIVHVKGASKIASVEVYDMSGKLMKTTKNVNSESTSLTVAYKGLAIVKLVLENGEVVTKKIILK